MKQKNKHLNLKDVKGFRTLFPDKYEKYMFVEKNLSEIARLHGYFMVETPAIEHAEVLTAKGGLSPEQTKEIFIFKDYGNRLVGLRFDITTPIARVIANNKDLQMRLPIRWQYFTRMWRYEQPQKGRYREFWQFGVENIGFNTPLADYEVVSLLIKQLLSLGLREFVVSISHRAILENILLNYGLKLEDTIEVRRILDKYDKIGSRILNEIDNYMISRSYTNEQIDLVIKFINDVLSLDIFNVKQTLNFIDKFKSKHPNLDYGGVDRLKQVYDLLSSSGFGDYVVIDLTLARGFDYYTGIIFESFLVHNRTKVSSAIAGGGRYDGLIGLFNDSDIPAVGYGIGVDRLIEALEERELIDVQTNPSMHILFDVSNPDHMNFALQLHEKLHGEGVSCTITLRKYKNWAKLLEKELKYCDRNNIKYAIIVDENITENRVIVKDLKKRMQKIIDVDTLYDFSNLEKIFM